MHSLPSFEYVQVPLHGQISPACHTTTVAEHLEILNISQATLVFHKFQEKQKKPQDGS